MGPLVAGRKATKSSAAHEMIIRWGRPRVFIVPFRIGTAMCQLVTCSYIIIDVEIYNIYDSRGKMDEKEVANYKGCG